jgi:hypothetical protein
VPDVVAHVGAVVDAADHEVGTVAEQTGQGDVHAVGRRAVHVAEAVGRFVDVQRRVQRERIRLRAVVVFRRDDLDFAQVADRFVQRHDAGCLVAVVVGEQDLHAAGIVEAGSPRRYREFRTRAYDRVHSQED